MIPFLASDLAAVLVNIMKRFLKGKKLSNLSPENIDISKEELELEWRHIDLGFVANKALPLLLKMLQTNTTIRYQSLVA
jgi:hypothetical protein